MRGVAPRRSHATVANAVPTACATSAVSWSPTVPRMSYSRKMVAGTFTEPRRPASAGGGCVRGGHGRRGRMDSGCRLHAHAAGAREVEQTVRVHAEEQPVGDGGHHGGVAQPPQPRSHMRLRELL